MSSCVQPDLAISSTCKNLYPSQVMQLWEQIFILNLFKIHILQSQKALACFSAKVKLQNLSCPISGRIWLWFKYNVKKVGRTLLHQIKNCLSSHKRIFVKFVPLLYLFRMDSFPLLFLKLTYPKLNTSVSLCLDFVKLNCEK